MVFFVDNLRSFFYFKFFVSPDVQEDSEESSLIKPQVVYNDRFEEKCLSSSNYSKIFTLHDDLDLRVTRARNIGIGWINGMNATYQASRETAVYLSILSGGYDVQAVYNATHGPIADLKECYLGLRYVATSPVRLLHQLWTNFFDRASDKATFLMICHSQGAIHVRNALLDYSEDLRSRITVLAIAPGAYIHSDSCAKVIHYRVINSLRDPVPRLDKQGSEREKNTIVEVFPSFYKTNMMDHRSMSPIYKGELSKETTSYVKDSLKIE